MLLSSDGLLPQGIYEADSAAISPAWFQDFSDASIPRHVNPADLTFDSVINSSKKVYSVSDGETAQYDWIVRFRPQVLDGISSVVETAGLLASDDVQFQVLRGLGISGQVLLRSTGATVESVASWLGSHEAVASYELDVVREYQLAANDPSSSLLWGLNNTGQTGGTADADIDAVEAWDITTGSSSVVVGVIDSGVDYTHPDLAANMWINPGEIPGNGIDDDGNGFIDDVHGYDFLNNDGDPMDDNGHGTHVSGTIAAAGNNGVGVAGVNWTGSIMGLKFLSADGSGYTSDAVRAVNYATMMRTTYGVNVRVTNNSWGGGGYSSALYDAIKAGGDAGILFVAAAGNSADNNDVTPHYPSNYDLDCIISVAATDHNDNLASFSSYGATTVDLAAPGVSIYSTVPGGGYASYSGTSMAAPHVAGVAALAWSMVDSSPSYERILDDGGSGYEEVGSGWYTGGLAGAYQGDYRYSLSGTGARKARWSFSGLADGDYQVFTTWTAHANRASNAPYSIYDASTLEQTVTVNQQAAPVDAQADAQNWKYLGSVSISSGTLTVELSDAADGVVVADAIRIVSGSAAPAAPSPSSFEQNMDDGASGYDEVGSGWYTGGLVGAYQGDYRYSLAGTGARKASWSFSGLTNGDYQVFTTWTAHANRASNAPYSIYDGSALEQTVTVNQQAAPADAQADAQNWKYLGSVSISSGTLMVELSDAADGVVVADAVRIVSGPPAPAAPTLSSLLATPDPVLQGDPLTLTADGVSDSDGTVVAVRFYRDSNDSGALETDTDALMGTDTNGGDGWSVSESSAGYALGSNRFFAQAEDNDGQLSNVVTTTGTVVDSLPSFEQNMDDGASGYGEVGGGWYTGGLAGAYQGDYRYSLAGTGARKARWSFSGLADGDYQVFTTWTAHANRASNAPYSIYDGSALEQTVTVNQQAAPLDAQADAQNWKYLGSVSIGSGTLTVELSDAANGVVVADAVRIVSGPPAPAPPSPPSLEQNMDDGASGYGEIGGGWYTGGLAGAYQGDYRYSLAGTGARKASWSFSGLANGDYQVFTTWTAHANRASNAPYSIYDGSALEQTVTVNQQTAPVDAQADDQNWEYLGSVSISSGTLTVELTDAADGVVVADAIRLVSGASSPAAASLSSRSAVPELLLQGDPLMVMADGAWGYGESGNVAAGEGQAATYAGDSQFSVAGTGTSWTEVRDAILQSTDPLASLTGRVVSGGRLNALGTLQRMGMAVTGSSPGAGSIVSSPPTDFTIHFSHDYDQATVDASDLTVNGIAADSFYMVDSDSVTFRFNSSPVTDEGAQQMVMAEGAILSAGSGQAVHDWQATFYHDEVAMTVTSATPGEGATVAAAPTSITLNFTEAVESASVDISDLTLTTGTILGATLVDSDTVRYDVDIENVEGQIEYTLTAGALADLFGNPSGAYTGNFVIDDPAITRYDSTDVPRDLIDVGTIFSTLTIPDAITIDDLDVELDITHTWDSDLDVWLIAPDGTKILLFSDVGDGGDNFTQTVLDDEASTPIGLGSAPFTGRFRPDEALSAVDGTVAAGTWTLQVTDAVAWDTGTLNSWTLQVTAVQNPAPAALVNQIRSHEIVEAADALLASDGNGQIDRGEMAPEADVLDYGSIFHADSSWLPIDRLIGELRPLSNSSPRVSPQVMTSGELLSAHMVDGDGERTGIDATEPLGSEGSELSHHATPSELLASDSAGRQSERLAASSDSLLDSLYAELDLLSPFQ